ncbi:MAG: hypothetical protein Q8K63_08100 [Acidimicrobiales bacterium]|nr:hypothetical protein [Acidimicrobiales bacterium]
MPVNATSNRPQPLPAEYAADDASRDWLNMVRICDAADIKPDTAYKWSRRGYPYWPAEARKLPNGSWRCRRCDLDAWILAQPWKRRGR